jgi:hypothetical protein
MTDARLPGRWLLDPRMDALSDRAWRVWTAALMFSAEQGTDGLIVRRSFRYLHEHGVEAPVLDELMAAGLVEITDDGGMQVLNWVQMGQSLAQSIEQAREAARTRKQNERARKREKGTGDRVRDVTRDDVGQDRTGEDRPGHGEEEPAGVGARVHDWPVREPGSGVA